MILLSQNIRIGSLNKKKPKSYKRSFSQNGSQNTFINLFNLTSTLERAITFFVSCFLVSRLPPTKIKYLQVDHMSSLSPA